ncbi:rhamnosyltransferase [Salirhabdus euzebyi]|uniref:Rhamnosyltransferase n=1 Tax=Salirhabdus euzebyi TaxID=394506 RepID=A0A841Q6G9_9BACI|nr:glycosyltransferase family 2 protein [Salirhabdus euzebyi]MBB6453998.1 rhamnosyltransferase [Salirhabdus euzebyi]
MKIVGVVVLYNPNNEMLLKNINSYLGQIDKLILVDNSDHYNNIVNDVFINNNKVEYSYLNGNQGIAFALNKGFDFAQKNEADWLLTMDQDSSFIRDDFSNFIKIINHKKTEYPDAVVFSPRHNVPYLKKEKGIRKVNSVMTSGNLINMKLVEKIGYFNESLFIDSVDHEFCYRINKMGYSVYRVNDIELDHNLGELEVKKLFGRKLYVTNHNYLRRYYITRNSLFVRRQYASSRLGFMKFTIDHLFWSFLTITLYEKKKLLKYKSMLLGLIDFKRGRLGKKDF